MRRAILVGAVLALTLPSCRLAPESPPATPAILTCLDRSITDLQADGAKVWAGNPIRLAVLEKVRKAADEGGTLRSLLALEIGLAGSQKIYNSIWLIETPTGVRSLTVETPEAEGKPAPFADQAVDPARYALLWEELLDLRVWNTPSDTQTVGLRADVPVFYATVCREGRLHRVRIENPPLPTWGKDDSFDQARRRHDKKAREFMLRPRDRAIEVMRLIQAF